MKYLNLLLLIAVSSLNLYSQGWINQPVNPQPNVLFSVSAFDENVVWASGDLGTVLFTSNGGANWIYRGSSLFGTANVLSIHAISAATALCVCNINGGKVFKTTNQGQNWFTVYSRSNVTLTDIEFLNSSTGYVFGNPVGNLFFIFKTTNGGVTFDTTSIGRPVAPNPNAMIFTNSTHLYQSLVGGFIIIRFGTINGLVYRSTNSGATWSSNVTQANDNIYSVTFMNANSGYAGGQDPYFSSNSGINWLFQGSLPNTGRFYSFINVSGYYYYSSGPGIYVSTNNGLSFTMQFTNPTDQDIRHISFTSNPNDFPRSVLNGWFVTSDGAIYHNEESIGITPIGTTVPKRYVLRQNYPNPFNPSTSFLFDLPEKQFVKLSVFDILGNVSEVIYEGELKAGSYKTGFDASHLASGVYFYRLQTPAFSETKKMILIK